MMNCYVRLPPIPCIHHTALFLNTNLVKKKDAETGKFKTEYNHVYNRFDPDEDKEQLVAAGKMVTNDLSGKKEMDYHRG